MPSGELGKESLSSVRLRIVVALFIGIAGGSVLAVFGAWKFAPLGAWDLAALVFLVWLWISLHGRNAKETARLALREDPGHAESDLLLIFASVASLGAVVVLLSQAKGIGGAYEILQVCLGVASVAISWTTVHTIYMLKYARMYYHGEGGIDFHSEEPPQYSDFAYMAFTVGMTFQVSDNDFNTSQFRRIALHHALLSFVFGTVILAITINLIAGLGK